MAALPHESTTKGRTHSVRSLDELEARCRELGAGQQLIETLLPAKSLALLVGDSGLGKSPLVYQMAICVATGTAFLGRPVQKGRVLILDYENGLAQTLDLAHSLQQHLGLSDLPEGALKFWSYNDCATGEETRDAIHDLIVTFRPSLVIVDSLTGYYPEIEERNANATQGIQSLRQAMRATDCTIVAVHHLRKPSNMPNAKPPRLEHGPHEWFLQARGARALINACDVRLGLEAAKSTQPDAAVILGGFARVTGVLPLLTLSRCYDDRGEPLGYAALAGDQLLPSEQRETYHQLPDCFPFKTAKQVYCKGDQATMDFLHKCIALRILYQEKRGGVYRKSAP